jgi:ABC-type uncharacterized transport system substrate-binding protein
MLGALFALGVKAEGIAILTNRNIEDCRNAAKAAANALQSRKGEKPPVSIFELDGGGGDKAILENLRSSKPSIVLSLGAYATKSARKALPDAWIVYAMVLYPEVEGFTSDRKMAGVEALGGEEKLRRMTKAFVHPSKVAVLHSVVIEESIPTLLDRLKAAGFAPEAFPLSEAPLMEPAMDELTSKYGAVLLLPDPITENADRLRFIITRCTAKRVVPLALTHGLVGRGALCGSYVKPEAAGERAAELAQKILAGNGPRQGSRATAESSPVVNGSVARLFGVTVEGAPPSGTR